MGLKLDFLISANSFRACSHVALGLCIFNAKAKPLIQKTEEVIAAVECKVKDPGDLKGFLGISRGSTILIETLSTYESSLLVNGEAYITGFPAVLNFNSRYRQFSFAGSSDSQEGSVVTLQIQGTLGSRSEASFLLNLQDASIDESGTAKLNACKRLALF